MHVLDKAGRSITYRYVRPEDDVDLITALLHEAYAPLAKQGMRFVASHQENSDEWNCGSVLNAFRGEGVIRPIEYAAGAVLLPRLQPGHDLVSVCLEGRDDDATDIIASLVQRMSDAPRHLASVRTVDRLLSEFEQFRGGAAGFIPASYVDRAEALFAELCRTQRNVRLLHGDLHHYNVLFDDVAGWVVIDPWGVIGEAEFEIGAALRNPIGAPQLLIEPRAAERRLQIYETRLKIDVDRALEVGVRDDSPRDSVAV